MSSYDVVLLPTFSQVDTYKKRTARNGGASMLGCTVTTFGAWIADLWELFGDGRTLVSSVMRDVLMRRALESVAREESPAIDVVALSHEPDSAAALEAALAQAQPDDARAAREASYLLAPGVPDAGATCARRASGLPAFEGALAEAASGTEVAGLSTREARFMRALARYYLLLAEIDCVEQGHAAAYLAEHAAEVFPAPLNVLVAEADPLPWIERRFFESCGERLRVRVEEAAGGDGVERAPAGIAVRFAFPAGRTADPALVEDVLRALGPDRSCVITAPDPLKLYRDLEAGLSLDGISCVVQGEVPFAQTDFGRAYCAMRACVRAGYFDPSFVTNVLLTPFSGIGKKQAYLIDAQLRENRLARVQRDKVLAELRAASEPFSQLEELARDPEADVLIGAFESMVQRMFHRSEEWRAEQLNAMSALREVTKTARQAGVAPETYDHVLQSIVVVVSFRVDPRGKEGVAAQDDSTVQAIITTQSLAKTLPAHGCSCVIVSDLSQEAYPTAERTGAAETLLEKLGLSPVDTALAKARRAFRALTELPTETLVLSRPLNDENADEAYPATVWEEFVDAYRPDPTATDDIDNPYRLPSALQPGLLERGEELLYANARARDAQAHQPTRARIPRPLIDYVEPDRRRFVVLPRRDSEGRALERACLSPSQIESYLGCPYRWFAERRLGIAALDEDFGPLEKGTFAHRALELFYTRFIAAGHPKVTPDTLPEAHALMRSVLDELVRDQFAESPGSGRLVPLTALEQRERDELCDRLSAYLDFEAQLLPSFHPAYLEYEIDADHAADYAGYQLVGKVDRIDVDDCGHAVIVDYKGSLSRAYSVGGTTDDNMGKVQTRIYATAIERLLGLQVVGALYVSYGKKPSVAGAYDPRVIEKPHLPGIDEGSACGARTDVPADPFALTGSDALSYEAFAFPTMLKLTERRVGQAIGDMVAGHVEAAPSNPALCQWCAVSGCPNRGANQL